MPPATDLHIQSRTEGAERVLSLSATAVRVGRGEQCEVRLVEDGLSEVQCLLRRRGETWHVQPIGPPGALSVEGRLVEAPRTLALGVPLRVGDHWLTLRAAGAEPPAVGSFDAPIIVPFRAVDEARAEPVVESRPALYRPSAKPVAERPTASPDRRWGQGLTEPILARGIGPVRPIPRPEPARPPSGGRPPLTPRRADPPIPRQMPRAEVPPTVEPKVAPQESFPPEPDRGGLDSTSLVSRLFDLAETQVAPTIEVPEASSIDPLVGWSGPREAHHLRPDQAAEGEPRTSQQCRLDRQESAQIEADLAPATVEVLVPRPAPAVEPPPVAAPSDRDITDTRVEHPAWQSPPAVVEPEPPAEGFDGWPEASRIILAGSRVPRPDASRSPGKMPSPSASLTPGRWAIPKVWAWGPLSALIVLGAVGGLGLSAIWAEDDRLSGVLADALVNARTLPGGPMAADLPASATWWGSTGPHLRLRAIAASRGKADAGGEGLARFYLNAARVASPLDAALRLDLTRREGAMAPTSRDVLALAWRGRKLREAGLSADSVASFRAAFAMAGTAPAPAGPTPLDDSPEVRRYTLPGEPLIGSILDSLWAGMPPDVEALAAELPRSALVSLAAYRALRDRRVAGAERLLDLAINVADDRPLDRAARAEALALRGDLAAAQAGYRDALDAATGAPWARLAWFNLGAIAARADDPAAARLAWDRARGDQPADPIARRVADAMAARASTASRTTTNDR